MAGINYKIGTISTKFHYPYEGIFGGGSKSITGNRYVDIFATSILSYKIYGNTIQNGTPTPEIPFEVKGVGDRTVNLLNLANVTNGYYYDQNGNYLSSESVKLSDFISVKSSENYIWVGKVTSGNLNLRISYFDSNKNFISQYVQAITSTTTINIQINPPSNTQYIRFSGNYTGTNRFVWEEIMLVEGSVAPTSYIPYGYQVPVKVTDKENLLPANAEAGELYPTNITEYTTFIASAKINDGSTSKLYAEIRFYDADKTQLDYCTLSEFSNGRMRKKFSINANVKYYAIVLKNSVPDGTTITDLKIERGETPTPYLTPTTTNIYLNSPLHKVGNYKDVLNSDGTITRNVGVKVLDETDNWEKQEYTIGNIGFRSRIIGKVRLKNEVICSHYLYSKLTTSNAPNNSILTFTSAYFDIKDNRFSTAEDFKAFIAQQYANGIPVIIYYPLATPTTETITAPEITLSGVGNYHIEIDTEVDATFDLTYI